ncbi:protein-tyrosine phosphatase [Bacillus tianshenii]|uniref:Tyrosine-protein phosphatase n=1 Tax=Sutcliffiella tianshenii TaxID=1463404 RepID=A0ABS2NV97_9BACI|nr:CpsB/CapC family capsule biosynthesis tyrosine phosphatase [Bacillus tianshenii]MBM7618407.1 protein-tyrosine phosphatase [Bacillus tianshenii]
MIDINCHILSSMDDGAKHMTESIEMARMAESQGIEIIVATPTISNGSIEDILGKVDEMNHRLRKDSINVTVVPGQECPISEDFMEKYENGQILTINNAKKFIFLSLEASRHVPHYTGELIYDIQMKGLTPIIANPELNIELMESPDKLYQLVKKGACVQLNAGSVNGNNGKKVKKFVSEIIDSNLAHFIASDARDKKSSSFMLQEAYSTIEKSFGSDIKEMFLENAELVFEGNSVFKEVPSRVKRKKLFGIFK